MAKQIQIERPPKVGEFVRYRMKNQLGLVGEVTPRGCRVWYHTGGTRAMSPYQIIELITFQEVLNCTFENEYAKASLIERSTRLLEGGDVSDLIDTPDIRKGITTLLYEAKKEGTNGC